MDARQSVGLMQTYFTHPEYLVDQCCVHTTCLSSDTGNQIGPLIYCYVKFFWRGWDTHLLVTHVIALWL